MKCTNLSFYHVAIPLKGCADSVIFCAGKNATSFEKDLTEDLAKIKTYFDDNELVINMNVGKTEVMLLGTAKRISMQPRPLEVLYNQQQVINTMEILLENQCIIITNQLHALCFDEGFFSNKKERTK